MSFAVKINRKEETMGNIAYIVIYRNVVPSTIITEYCVTYYVTSVAHVQISDELSRYFPITGSSRSRY